MPLKDLVEICHRVGARIPHWTQGKGGNISVKEGERLWIKASGERLCDVSPSRGIACVDVARVGSIFSTCPAGEDPDAWYARALVECTTGGTRPSMETGFHAVLPRTWVLHFHSLAAIVMAHEESARPEVLADFLQRHSDLTVAFVPPEIPGWNLSLRLLDHAGADAVVLANHGVVLQGDEPNSLLDRWERLERAFCREWSCPELVTFGTRLRRSALTATAFRAYFPDAVVFRDGIAAVIDEASVASAPGSRDQQDAEEMLEAIVLLGRACPRLAELGAADCAAIATLPAEAFRRS